MTVLETFPSSRMGKSPKRRQLGGKGGHLAELSLLVGGELFAPAAGEFLVVCCLFGEPRQGTQGLQRIDDVDHRAACGPLRPGQPLQEIDGHGTTGTSSRAHNTR